ncbi:Beta-galactosidase [Rhodovulum sp. PH10]|uniref:GH1 family beta-glucosidase n=1 Tax=Rhodovulum sp. PH10 TaxID=1187851 RepID=UPI00027C2267|nr:GH1 family beta-glucosidase [Rhodovulum sp. PH10]EJW09580.1 Beta-galactosidase [Rhodovulum sp. PH10]
MSTRAPATVAAASNAPFVWGVSTSSYQIEGAAAEDGKGPSIWDAYCRQPGRITDNDTGDVACDHYHRYREDVALMKALGVGAYRFSVSWPRVLPKGRGAANEPGLAFYDRLIDELLAAGIEPWLCLYHWDLPQALGDLGGWASRDTAFWFADYAALIARRYGDRVKRFATFNESSVFTLFGFVMGGQAPGIVDRDLFHRAIHHVNLGHGLAIDVLRANVKDASLGIVHNIQPCRPATPAPEDVKAAALFDAYWNGAFADPQILGVYPSLIADLILPWAQAGDLAKICRPIDWFGLNHYSPHYMKAGDGNPLGVAWGPAPESVRRTAMGWPIEPDAFRDTLVFLSDRYRLPVYVLENGTANPDVVDAKGEVHDPSRIDYLKAYIGALGEARAAGADVRGYFIWSLLDNFEWGSGYSQRFGIVHVDYATGKRTPKASYHWYADLIRAQAAGPRAVSPPLVAVS